jgi:hypothetical protein
MKKPTLRLRQVFEGPTHFKVVKPLGNPIKIAKKGLSPNLMGRLRKFATAGEVTEPVYGSGSVSEQLDQVRRDIENEQLRDDANPDVLGMLRERESQLVDQQIVVPPFSVADIVVPKSTPTPSPVGTPIEVIKSSSVAQEPIEKLGPGEDITVNGTATPSPAPRMVATPEAQRMGPFEEIAPVMRRAVVSEEQPVATVASAPVRRSPAIALDIAGAPGAATVEMPTVPVAEPAPSLPAAAATQEEDLTPVQYARQLIRQELKNRNVNPDLLRQYFETLKDAVTVERAERNQLTQATAAAPVVAPAPAPVAAPAAAVPAAAAAPVAPASPVKTVAAVAAPAEKPAPVEPSPLEKALGGLGYTMDQYNAMPAPMKVAAQQAVRATIAAQTAADAEAKALEQETAAYAEQEKALKKEADSLAASAKAARETQQKILDEYDYLKNPTNYFASLNPLQQIGTAISLALGAFASGMTGMPNFAQKIYDNAIEQDLQAQKRKSDSLYQRLVQAGNSVNSAEDLVRAQLKLIGAAEMSRRSAQIKLPQVKAQIEAKAASEALKATSEMQRIAKDQATMAREADLGPLRVREAKAKAVIAEGTPARLKKEMDLRIEENTRKREEAEQKREDRLQAAADRREEERIARGLTVGTTELELKSKTGGKDVRDDIGAREQAIMSVMKLDELMRTAGVSVFDPSSNLRGEAIAELNTMIENYPKLQGFKRAISVSAKDQLKLAINDALSWKAALKEVFLGRDPAVAIHSILEEGKRSYANQVKKQVRDSSDPKVEAAIQSFYKDAAKEIAKYKAATAADEALLSEE